MTTEVDTKINEATEKKEEVKKEEEVNNATEKQDDQAEKADKEKKDEDKKEVKPKKEAAPPKPAVHKQDFEKETVYLYQFSRTAVLPSLSPYCLKAETWLRLAGIKYENVDHKMKYKSKKGQLPFVELNGEEIADSAIIIKQLTAHFKIDLDESLTPEQRNTSYANVMMIENHLAWVVKSWRTTNPAGMLKAYKLDLPRMLDLKWPKSVLEFLFKLKFRRAAKKVRAHGIGVHKPEEIEEFGHDDLHGLSELLGDKAFFFGESPTTLDIVAFSNLAQLTYMDKEVSYSLRDWMVEHCPNLVEFCHRMKDRAFPDWDEMCKNLDLNSHLPKPPPKEEEKEEKKDAEEKKEGKGTEEKEKDEKENEKAAPSPKKEGEDNKIAEESKEAAK